MSAHDVLLRPNQRRYLRVPVRVEICVARLEDPALAAGVLSWARSQGIGTVETFVTFAPRDPTGSWLKQVQATSWFANPARKPL